MKKLMIAAAAAMCGMVASAALVQWGVDESYQEGSFNVLDEGYYAFFLVDTGAFLTSAGGEALGSIYSITSAKTDLANGDASFVTDYAIKNEGGTIANAISGGAVGANTASVFANDQDIVGYLVLMDNIDPSKATKAFLADVTETGDPATTHISTIGGADPIQFGYLEGSAVDGSWYAVNAPEPTSGLLLLLGVAGLALRRRRA